MFGPVILFPQQEYASLQGGNAKAYFARIPFAGMVKSITVSALNADMSSNTQAVFTLEQSLDGINWKDVGGSGLGTLLSTERFEVYHSSTDLAAMVRLRMEISETTPTTQVFANVEVRASGKPF